MKFKIYFYRTLRVSLGVLLTSYSVYNTIEYNRFLERLDVYFGQATVFNISVIELLAPLVPFEEFVIGLFLTLGMSTKKVLQVLILLFGFFTLFLFDAGHWHCATIHFLILFVSLLLLLKNDYDVNSNHFYSRLYL